MTSPTILATSPAMGLLVDHGVLDTTAVHAAMRIGDLVGVHDERERLALALAVRALTRGHVALDLDTVSNVLALEELADLDDAGRATITTALETMVAHVHEVGS